MANRLVGIFSGGYIYAPQRLLDGNNTAASLDISTQAITEINQRCKEKCAVGDENDRDPQWCVGR